MKLGKVVLREISQTQKDKTCTIPFTGSTSTGQAQRQQGQAQRHLDWTSSGQLSFSGTGGEETGRYCLVVALGHHVLAGAGQVWK